MHAKLIRWFFCLAGAGALSLGSARAAAVDSRLVGRWSGTAEIVVDWTLQRTLLVELMIAADGSVAGRVGDARLVGGWIARNRGAVGRLLHLKSDYLVTGQLVGDIIAAEKVQRKAVKLPLTWLDGRLVGGLHTSGSKFGGRAEMILSATRLKLERQPALP